MSIFSSIKTSAGRTYFPRESEYTAVLEISRIIQGERRSKKETYIAADLVVKSCNTDALEEGHTYSFYECPESKDYPIYSERKLLNFFEAVLGEDCTPEDMEAVTSEENPAMGQTIVVKCEKAVSQKGKEFLELTFEKHEG